MNNRRGSWATNVTIGLAVTAGVVVAAAVVVTINWAGGPAPAEFAYDISALQKVDPKLIAYRQVLVFPTDLTASRSLAVDGRGRVYVAGDTVIRMFDESGRRLGDIETASPPTCVTLAEDRAYVGFKDHVEVYDLDGNRLASWPGLGPKAVVTSIAVGEDGVFLADAGNRVVLLVDDSGKPIRRIGQKDERRNIPPFVIPSPYFDVAIAPDGLLRITDPGRHRVCAFTAEGDLEFTWGRFGMDIEGFSGCCNPVNFAVLPDGGFVTCEKGLTRVKVYDPEGRFVCVVAAPGRFAKHDAICSSAGGCNTGGLDVACDSQGKVFVLDPLTNEVRVFVRKSAAADVGGGDE